MSAFQSVGGLSSHFVWNVQVRCRTQQERSAILPGERGQGSRNAEENGQNGGDEWSDLRLQCICNKPQNAITVCTLHRFMHNLINRLFDGPLTVSGDFYTFCNLFL